MTKVYEVILRLECLQTNFFGNHCYFLYPAVGFKIGMERTHGSMKEAKGCTSLITQTVMKIEKPDFKG